MSFLNTYQQQVIEYGGGGGGTGGGAGVQGPRGFQGWQGIVGAGVQGSQGIVGAGVQGSQGFQGIIGLQGVQGFQGGAASASALMVYNGAPFTVWTGSSATFYTIPISGGAGDYFETNINAYFEAGNTVELNVGGRILFMEGGSFGRHFQLKYTTRIISSTEANTTFVGNYADNDGDFAVVKIGTVAVYGFNIGLTAGVGSFGVSGDWFSPISAPTQFYGASTIKFSAP